MNERPANRLGLAALAVAVLAVHLWLLGALPRLIRPAARDSHFVARTITPEPAAAPQVPTPPAPIQEPAPPSPRKPAATPPKSPSPAPTSEPTRRTREAAAPTVAPPPPAVSTPAIAAASAASAPASRQAVASAGAAAASRFAVLPSARIHYDVIAQAKGFTLRGKADLDWRNEHGAYEAQLQMASNAPFVKPRVQRSSGLVTAQGLAPIRFSDKVRSEEAAHFDREQGKVTFSTNKPEAALEPGAQDRLSIVLQLGAMMAGSPAKFPAGSQITVQTASTKEAEPWTFTVEAPETLDLPGGRVRAVRLTRNPRKEYDTKVELWLAPGQAYAPVRLRLTQPNGDWVDQQWSSTDRG